MVPIESCFMCKAILGLFKKQRNHVVFIAWNAYSAGEQ